ncbi:hypothetical protein JRQ81_008660 [Phrynocephalus forsythii]|uniref:Protein FAM163B n=1 Tax=Phrynocephalus forsythii TaxID=171643 RepID=A0A9Q0XCH1_9SAUR|nr:hypothetical protein JRQ81_008660 [Phrynocephalus forsythii]
MTAGTVVITGGILATVILLCIIAVLCYCRLQYYCCKKEESEEDGDEPDFGVDAHIPPLHCNRNVALTNGPSLYRSSSPCKKGHQGRTLCPGCSHYEPPSFFLQEPEEEEEEEEEDGEEEEEEEVRNGGNLVNYKALSQEDLEPPAGLAGLQPLNPNRLSAMREAFSRSRSISTDV